MASAIGHIAAALTLGGAAFPKYFHKNVVILAVFCALVPDLDVIPLFFGVPYRSVFGHRGWTHSILFALVFGTLMGRLVSRKHPEWRLNSVLWMVSSTLSHPLLDMMTQGGLGVVLFFPFYNQRYFFAFRPLVVVPLKVGGLLGKWGWPVLKSELLWIVLPCLSILLLFGIIRHLIFKSDYPKAK
ncbi:MAG: metal-dependent hydrolase [Bacteroidetes bacterium]|nr:metal-dependent hydrolase [Bacteroidota bacterium]